MSVDDQPLEARGPEPTNEVLEEWRIADGQERLRKLVCQRAEPHPIAGRENHRAFDKHEATVLDCACLVKNSTLLLRAWYGESMRGLGRMSLFALFSIAFWSCNSGATGIDTCRSIETRKCEFLVGCPNVAIASASDVDACILFYRDACLHGLADAVEPPPEAVSLCLSAIDQAGSCKTVSLASCAKPPALASGLDTKTVTGCDAMLATEKLADCAFLTPPNGAGGATATASTTAVTGASSTTTGAGGAGGAG